MGYISDHTIKVEKVVEEKFLCDHENIPDGANFCPFCGTPKRIHMDIVKRKLEELCGYSVECAGREIYIMGAKWYGYMEDMLKLSNIYSNVLFSLYIEGEEKNDFQKYYFYNGRSMNVGPVVISFTNDTEEKRNELLDI